MSVQVHIYLAENKQIQLLLQGQAQGAVTFTDFETFSSFIDKCQEFIASHNQTGESSTPIPQPFLDAFNGADQQH
jgi:hypothetical protein